jgi:hypothetical protein
LSDFDLLCNELANETVSFSLKSEFGQWIKGKGRFWYARSGFNLRTATVASPDLGKGAGGCGQICRLLSAHHHRKGTEIMPGRQLLRDRQQQSPAADADEGLAQNKPTELIELRRTLTELNDAVIQVARSGHLEQAHQVRELLVQVKREVYKLLAEQ